MNGFDPTDVAGEIQAMPELTQKTAAVVFSAGELPKYDGSERDKQVFAKWKLGFGDLDERVDEYLAGDIRLGGISLNWYSADEYANVARGNAYLERFLAARGVAHETRVWEGTHFLRPVNVTDGMLPFFTACLAAQGFTQP
jgi:hypothetical protein